MDWSTLGSPVLHCLLEFAHIHVHWVGNANHLIFYHPLLLLPSIFLSIRVFSSDSALCILQPKYWSFSFSTNPSDEYSGLISFRIDWFNLLVVQGTLKSLLQPKFENNSNQLFLYIHVIICITIVIMFSFLNRYD